MLLSVAIVVPLLQVVLAVPTPEAAPGGLDALIKAKGKKYFGTCADRGTLGNAQNSAIITREFGAVTPENR
jgi:endo-1,4-beta-xylanase